VASSSIIRWATVSDSVRVGRLLSSRFDDSHRARIRFAAKVALTPHLVVGRGAAVVGISPTRRRSAPRRLLDALTWAGTSPFQPFASDPRSVPRCLRRYATWRIINLASANGVHPWVTVRLVRSLEALADAVGVDLEVQIIDGRALRTYQRHGFCPSSDDASILRRRSGAARLGGA
jgi:hypothetical protein